MHACSFTGSKSSLNVGGYSGTAILQLVYNYALFSYKSGELYIAHSTDPIIKPYVAMYIFMQLYSWHLASEYIKQKANKTHS